MKVLFFLLLLGSASALRAQESQYEQMKSVLDEYSLPLVNLTVNVDSMRADSFLRGRVEVADFQRRTNPDTLSVSFSCLLRYRGATSRYYRKKSFAVKLIDGEGEDLDANLFGIRAENSWVLDAMAIDRIRMRNRVCFDCWNAMSHTPYLTNYGNRNGTDGLFVEVFINGSYHGLYCLSDKIDRKLLGLKKIKMAGTEQEQVRGLLYKGKDWSSGSNLLSYDDAPVDTADWNAWELQYPSDFPSADTWQPLMDLIDFCSYRTSLSVFQHQYEDYFYSENLVDYVAFTLALGVGDNAYKNTFLSVPNITEAHRFLLSPWDMDMSFGGNWDGNRNHALQRIDRYDGIAPFQRLHAMNLDDFADRVKQRYAELSEDVLSAEAVEERLQAYARMFKQSGAWQREYERWNNNPVPLTADVDDELAYAMEWLEQNYIGLCAQWGLSARPMSVASIPTAEPAMVIYTLDGRRVSAAEVQQLPKGIYVVNGKKLAVQ